MNGKLIGVIAVIALLVGAFAFYLLISTPAETIENDLAMVESKNPTNAPSSEPSDVPESGAGALRELFATDADIECAFMFDDTERGRVVNGTLFQSGGELRIDSLLQDEEFGQYVSSLVFTADTVYLWSDIGGETYGVKTDRVEGESSADALNAPVDLNSEVNYQCQAWETVDGSVFTPPGDVLFRDFEASMESGMEYGTIYEEGSTALPVTPPAAQ